MDNGDGNKDMASPPPRRTLSKKMRSLSAVFDDSFREENSSNEETRDNEATSQSVSTAILMRNLHDDINWELEEDGDGIEAEIVAEAEEVAEEEVVRGRSRSRASVLVRDHNLSRNDVGRDTDVAEVHVESMVGPRGSWLPVTAVPLNEAGDTFDDEPRANRSGTRERANADAGIGVLSALQARVGGALHAPASYGNWGSSAAKDRASFEESNFRAPTGRLEFEASNPLQQHAPHGDPAKTEMVPLGSSKGTKHTMSGEEDNESHSVAQQDHEGEEPRANRSGTRERANADAGVGVLSALQARVGGALHAPASYGNWGSSAAKDRASFEESNFRAPTGRLEFEASNPLQQHAPHGDPAKTEMVPLGSSKGTKHTMSGEEDNESNSVAQQDHEGDFEQIYRRPRSTRRQSSFRTIRNMRNMLDWNRSSGVERLTDEDEVSYPDDEEWPEDVRGIPPVRAKVIHVERTWKDELNAAFMNRENIFATDVVGEPDPYYANIGPELDTSDPRYKLYKRDHQFGHSKNDDTRKLERAAFLVLEDIRNRVTKELLMLAAYKKLLGYV